METTLPAASKKSSWNREEAEPESKGWWGEELDKKGRSQEEKLHPWNSAKELALPQTVDPYLVTAPFIEHLLLFQSLS